MAIERVGPHFIQLLDEAGLRTIVGISSIQVAAESDEMGTEVLLTAGSRTFRVNAPLDELRAALEDDWRLGLFGRPGA